MLTGAECKSTSAISYKKNYWNNQFFIEDDLLWVRIKIRGELARVCLDLPNHKIADILATSHGTLFTGHKGVDKNHKKYILCMTDACTQYVELVTLPKKEAETITDTIFSHWICQLGIPVEVITDLGKEFCNKLTDKLFQLMEIKHGWTSALVQHSSRSGKQDNC